MKMLKTQGSKEILIEMDEGRLRSLEKVLFVRRNGEMMKKNQGKETSKFQKSNVSQKYNLLSIKIFLIRFKSRRNK